MPDWRELLSEPRRVDREVILRDLSASDIDELILVSTGGDVAERELAFGLLAMLESRLDARFLGQPRQTWHDLQLEANREARHRPPECEQSRVELHDVIATEVVLRLPVAGGGELALGPGRVKCAVYAWVEANPLAVQDSSDFIHLEARVTDAGGDTYGASRRWSVDRLVLPLLSRDDWAGPEKGVERFAQGLRCFADHRNRYPAVGWVAGAFTFSYWAKYLYLTIDLQVLRGVVLPNGERALDTMIAKIHPSQHGGVAGPSTPVVRAGLPFLARMVFCPGLLMGHYPHDALALRHYGKFGAVSRTALKGNGGLDRL